MNVPHFTKDQVDELLSHKDLKILRILKKYLNHDEFYGDFGMHFKENKVYLAYFFDIKPNYPKNNRITYKFVVGVAKYSSEEYPYYEFNLSLNRKDNEQITPDDEANLKKVINVMCNENSCQKISNDKTLFLGVYRAKELKDKLDNVFDDLCIWGMFDESNENNFIGLSRAERVVKSLF